MAPRLKNEDREQVLESNREALLAAAADELAREGYNGANINRISQVAGFAKGTVYNYFASKEALMLAVLDEYAAAHFRSLAGAVQAVDDPEARLKRFFEAGFDFVAQHLAPSRVMVNTIYGPNPDFKAHLYQAYVPMFEFVATEILVPGMAQGYFRAVDPGRTASLLITIYLGTASQVTDAGEFFLDVAAVVDFGLHALRN
jgi:AcrR family transcriptional regulator